MISVPIFAFLVVHLSGHGMMLFLEEGHTHEHDEHHLLDMIFNTEILSGILLLILFVWLWNRPGLKKWVPCCHTNCSHTSKISHIMATVAFCLHFFPEAGIRHEMFMDAFDGNTLHLIGAAGFLAHFLIDIIIAVILSSFWKKPQAAFSFLIIAASWMTAFLNAENFSGIFSESAEGVVFLVSAFLLAMFVHKPHRR